MPEHEVRSHLRYRRNLEHNMPTGTKIATIVLVVLLGAAGLYYAFVAPPASNTKSNAEKETGTTTSTVPTAPSTLTLTPTNGTGATAPATAPMPTNGTAANTPRGNQPTFAPGTLGSAGTGKGDAFGAGTGTAPGVGTGTTGSAGTLGAGTAGSLPANGLATGGGNAARPTAPTGQNNGFSNGFPANNQGTAPAGNPLASNPGFGTGSNGANTGASTGTPSGGPSPTGTGTTVATGPGNTTGSTAPTASGERTHVIASGDTFSTLAQKYYGNANKWQLIAKANPLVSADRLKIGTKVRIPDAGTTTTASKSTTPTVGTAPATTGASANAGNSTGATGNFHVVASGDTLSSLARKYYGSTKYWEKLYTANKSTIGANPANLKVGQKLAVPPKTTIVSGENVGG